MKLRRPRTLSNIARKHDHIGLLLSRQHLQRRDHVWLLGTKMQVRNL